MSLQIEIYPPVNGNQYVTLDGRLDTLTHESLDARLEPLLAERPQTLVMDLARLEYISSAGVRSILKTRKIMNLFGGRLVVVHPQEQVRRVIELVQAVPPEVVFASTEELDAYLDAVQRQILGQDGDPEAGSRS